VIGNLTAPLEYCSNVIGCGTANKARDFDYIALRRTGALD
jgi:hypothetical protein